MAMRYHKLSYKCSTELHSNSIRVILAHFLKWQEHRIRGMFRLGNDAKFLYSHIEFLYCSWSLRIRSPGGKTACKLFTWVLPNRPQRWPWDIRSYKCVAGLHSNSIQVIPASFLGSQEQQRRVYIIRIQIGEQFIKWTKPTKTYHYLHRQNRRPPLE